MVFLPLNYSRSVGGCPEIGIRTCATGYGNIYSAGQTSRTADVCHSAGNGWSTGIADSKCFGYIAAGSTTYPYGIGARRYVGQIFGGNAVRPVIGITTCRRRSDVDSSGTYSAGGVGYGAGDIKRCVYSHSYRCRNRASLGCGYIDGINTAVGSCHSVNNRIGTGGCETVGARPVIGGTAVGKKSQVTAHTYRICLSRSHCLVDIYISAGRFGGAADILSHHANLVCTGAYTGEIDLDGRCSLAGSNGSSRRYCPVITGYVRIGRNREFAGCFVVTHDYAVAVERSSNGDVTGRNGTTVGVGYSNAVGARSQAVAVFPVGSTSEVCPVERVGTCAARNG